ncbi:MAG: ATP-binding protein [Syntrophobacterales bacterium]|jgi:two-component system OmpR family sensor kinase|nr:ATP-binding protein [Syntrophobacterales bacterium]
MDGFKKRVKDSLQIRLSFWLSLAILSVALIAGIFAFFSAFNEAHELQDDVLRQVAMLYDRHGLTVPQTGNSGTGVDNDPESRVFIQLLSTIPPSNPNTDANPTLALPQNLRDGLQTVHANNETYRVLVRTLGSGERLAVAQETAVRDEIARDSSLRTLMPFLVLVPILLLVVAYLIRKIFKPIAALSIEIDQRSEQELHPIAPEPFPAEIRPFVGAINRLLKRVEQSMATQRRFVADAAHELRSPLTALSLQAERLADAEMSANAHERLNTLRQGIERGRTLLDQMLALARAQASEITSNTSVSVQQVYRHVLEDLMPLAEAKGIDIGVVSDSDAHVPVNEVDLITLVKNLVDNAVRYTPTGGRVDLSFLATKEGTTLVVEDNGPGIPEAERERVFDPFYRVLGSDEIGSGLGLSIVQTISARVGAKVSFGYASDQSRSGLRVMVTFPLRAS